MKINLKKFDNKSNLWQAGMIAQCKKCEDIAKKPIAERTSRENVMIRQTYELLKKTEILVLDGTEEYPDEVQNEYYDTIKNISKRSA